MTIGEHDGRSHKWSAVFAGPVMVSCMESTMRATGPVCEHCRAIGHDATAHTDPEVAERMARLALQRGDEAMANHWRGVVAVLRARAA